MADNKLFMKELEAVLQKISEMAVTIVTQLVNAPVNTESSFKRKELQLFEIEQRLQLEMLLQRARVLTAKTTGRGMKRRREEKREGLSGSRKRIRA